MSDVDTIYGQEVLLGVLANWFSRVRCGETFVSTKCYLGILPIGSDVWMPLRTICDHCVIWTFLPVGSDVCLTSGTICIGKMFVWGSILVILPQDL